MSSEFTYVDLFSGAGGFSEGFHLSSEQFKLVCASDIHANAALTHVHRFSHQLGIDYDFITRDIKDRNFISMLMASVEKRVGKKGVDIVCGGPPCQGFSVFGKRDEDDPRNTLFSYYLRVIEKLRPKYFIMENVPGLETMYDGKVVKAIYRSVESMKSVKYALSGPIHVNASDFGVPQNRGRILFIGSRSDCPKIDSMPATHRGPKVTTGEAISDLSFLRAWEEAGKYDEKMPAVTEYQKVSRLGRFLNLRGTSLADGKLHNHKASKHNPLVIARFSMIEKGCGLESIPEAFWENHLKSDKKWCVRLDDSKPAYTMVTLPDDFVHYRQHRALTVREMARLQSFDDTHIFFGPRASGGGGVGNKKRLVELPQYTQVGNAVPPLMAKAIADRVHAALVSMTGSKTILFKKAA